jgi:hypothetical protein
MSSLNINGCTALSGLYINNNRLTALNANGLNNLVHLCCQNNNLTSINVNGCTRLDSLNCDNNNLSSLDVSQNTELTRLSCSGNHLTALNVTGLNSLTRFNGDNQTVSLRLYKHQSNGTYDRIIQLNAPSFGSNAIIYLGDKLISASNTVASTDFTVKTTGHSTYKLSGTMNFKYSEHPFLDMLAALRGFLSQISYKPGFFNAQLLGLTLADMSDWETNDAWKEKLQGVTWNTNNPNQILSIEWKGKDLAGKLDLSGCPGMWSIDCSANKLTSLEVGDSEALRVIW